MEPFIGQVIAVGFNFTPRGWLPCTGQLISIAEYSTLYALIGTTYGGDGQVTFALPDLRGRTPINQGTAPGLGTYVIGQVSGTENVSLTSTQNAAHTHMFIATTDAGTTATPGPGVGLAPSTEPAAFVYDAPPGTVSLKGDSISPAGQGLPHENRQPLLAVNYIIAAEGIFPQQG